MALKGYVRNFHKFCFINLADNVMYRNIFYI